jgi:DNA-binding NarL/FixJ family response regulator
VSPSESAVPRVVKLMLVDADPVFRLGLRLGLERVPDLRVVAEAETGAIALEQLADPAAERIDLVLLNVALGAGDPTQIQGFDLCRQIKQDAPDQTVLLLSDRSEAVLIAAAQQVGADGYCPRQAALEVIVGVIRRLRAGQATWLTQAESTDPAIAPADAAPLLPPPGPWARLRRRTGESGLAQIEAAIAAIAAELDESSSDWATVILQGRQRELRAARWLVRRWLVPPLPERPTPAPADRAEPQAIIPVPTSLAAVQDVQSILFDAVLAKLRQPLINQTRMPLELEVLREEKRRELCYLILRRLETSLDDLRYSQVSQDDLPEKRSLILGDLWQGVVTDFLGRYYTVPMGDRTVDVVPVMLADRPRIQQEFLDPIPFVADWFAHLLFQAPLMVERTAYPVGNPAAIARAELILDHLVIHLANAVVQPLLNRFATVEPLKQAFFDRRVMSFREMERFRNDLSWRYRLTRYFAEPTDIFESQYRLYALRGRTIRHVAVYAPRAQDLDDLSGLPYVVTLALETRDAIAPRLRAAIAFVGSGVIYVLTDVIGRGIGLVGRGILKGVGDAWQDSRVSRNK